MINKPISRSLHFILSAIFTGLILTGCGKSLQESDAPYAAPMLDTMLSGFAEKNYEKFSLNFSVAMKEAIAKENFAGFLTKMNDSLGAYKGRTFKSLVKTKVKGKDYTIVNYTAIFEKEADVTIMFYISDNQGIKCIEGFGATPSAGSSREKK